MTTVQAAEPTDISNHWAQDYILNLVNTEIMPLYPDGSFKPENNINRLEFCEALSNQLNIIPSDSGNFSDLDGSKSQKLINTLVDKKIINGYPDGTFKPERDLTKAEIITIMIKSLGIIENKETINIDSYHPFEDLNDKHWAANNIKIASKVGLIDKNQENLYPNKKITRAEAAKYLVKLSYFEGHTGYMTDFYPTSQKISVNLLSGDRKIYNIYDQSLIGRNNRIVSLDEIMKTDKIFIINNLDNNIQYLKAYGMVTEEDLTTEVSKLTKGTLSPDEVKTLAEGDIKILKPKILDSVQKQLISQGLTKEEVIAIMSSDWDRLETHSKNRLAEAIAIQTGLPLDITISILSGD